MSLIAFLVIGLIVGLVARAIFPGTQSMGVLATTALGIVGSFVGSLVSALVYGRNNYWGDLHTNSILFSIAGAMIVLLAVSGLGRRVRA